MKGEPEYTDAEFEVIDPGPLHPAEEPEPDLADKISGWFAAAVVFALTVWLRSEFIG